jgi:hypothetical protein
MAVRFSTNGIASYQPYPDWAFLVFWDWGGGGGGGGECPRSISPGPFGVFRQTFYRRMVCLAEVHYRIYVVMATNYDVIMTSSVNAKPG